LGIFMKRQFVLKNLLMASICLVPLAWSTALAADEFRRGQFLALDLSTAVLSPKPLGPSAEFVLDLAPSKPVETKPIGSRPDREDTRPAALAQGEIHLAHVQSEAPKRSGKRHAVAHARPARHRGNPLDAQAFDARIRAWPCKSGGICNWKRDQE
jgi:hypothetical protein